MLLHSISARPRDAPNERNLSVLSSLTWKAAQATDTIRDRPQRMTRWSKHRVYASGGIQRHTRMIQMALGTLNLGVNMLLLPTTLTKQFHGFDRHILDTCFTGTISSRSELIAESLWPYIRQVSQSFQAPHRHQVSPFQVDSESLFPLISYTSTQ